MNCERIIKEMMEYAIISMTLEEQKHFRNKIYRGKYMSNLDKKYNNISDMEDKKLTEYINNLLEGQIITQEDGTESVLLINKDNHNHVLVFTVYDGTIYLNGTGLDEDNRTVGYKGNPITMDTVRLIALHTVRTYVSNRDIDGI